MKIAIEGCAHGELDKIYGTIEYIQHRENIKIDLLICCGDFQSVRDRSDMLSMAVPQKYMEMKDFSKYYNGTVKAPVLTLFIGGNHESANYLWELPYGGWVAENIYYLGYAGVVDFAGLRIAGLSGIFKFRDYSKAHFERPPFTEDTKRSFYHVRNCDVAKLKLLEETVFDICLSHDWPKNIYNHGDAEQLMRFKPFLREEIIEGTLGSNAAEELLNSLKPKYWFSGHMHAKFSALVTHVDGRVTKFLALDKCLPKRNFLQIIDMDSANDDRELKHDPYWLCVLQTTDANPHQRSFCLNLPETMKPSEFDVKKFLEEHPDMSINKFVKSQHGCNQQTTDFCARFNLTDPCITALSSKSNKSVLQSTPKRKFELPTPSKLSLPTPSKSSNDDDDEFRSLLPTGNLVKTIPKEDDEDFSELINPNISSNPDEIDISDSSSDISDDDERDSVPLQTENRAECKESVSNSTSVSGSDANVLGRREKLTNISFPSFIETPVRQDNRVSVSAIDGDSEISFSESGGESNAQSCSSPSLATDSSSVPTPSKKFKLVRRNQQLYTPSKDEE